MDAIDDDQQIINNFFFLSARKWAVEQDDDNLFFSKDNEVFCNTPKYVEWPVERASHSINKQL